MSLVELIQDYRGYSYNQKIIDDCHKIVLESKKHLDPIALAECCLISVLDKGEIKSLGSSIPSDLINNNFGLAYRGLFLQVVAAANVSEVLKDIANVSETIFLNDMQANNGHEAFTWGTAGLNIGFRIQVGQGSSAPARSDFNIETPFGTSPEDTDFNINPSAYNITNGKITFGNSIVAGAAGTVSEAIYKAFFNNSVNAQKEFLMFRDLVSPGVVFILGNTIAVDWVFQLWSKN